MAEPVTAEVNEPDPRVAELVGCIAQYDREYLKWKNRAKKVVQKYRGGHDTDSDGGTAVKFNILWSNVQTLVPATFSKLPAPDVSRRFRDNDPVGRVAAMLLQRSLEYEIEHYPDYAASMRQCVFDRFLGGRGTEWIRYEPHFRALESDLPTDGVEISEDIDEPGEELDYECSPVDYVHPDDFGHSVARTWEEVSRVWRWVYMYEDAVRERFGDEIADTIAYDASPDQKNSYKGGDSTPKQAKIAEVWDKETKTAIWFSKSMNKFIDERPDPLGLSDFFPCPRPLYATITNGTLVPIPDYKLYEEQALELDVLSDRIDGLIKALKVRGVYDSAVPELARLFTEGSNNDLIPVKNFAAFAEKNGLAGAIDLVDLEPFAKALKEAYLAMSQVKEYIYEITGISDIVRGQTNANETLGAQQIKQNFVGLRLKDMQMGVARFAAEALSIKGQVICGKYSPETIRKISAANQLSEADLPYVDQALELLVGPERMADPQAKQGPNPTRQFRIDVASDSLVQMDEAAEKADRMEFLKATGAFIKEAFPIIEASPEAAPLLVAMLKFGVTGFKVGRAIEGDFDMALDKLKQQAAQPRQPKPDPEMERVAADAAIQKQRADADAAAAQAKLQSEERAAQAKAWQEQQTMFMERQMETQRTREEALFARFEALLEAKTEKEKAHIQAETAVEVAEIGARATITAGQQSAARQASQGD